MSSMSDCCVGVQVVDLGRTYDHKVYLSDPVMVVVVVMVMTLMRMRCETHVRVDSNTTLLNY